MNFLIYGAGALGQALGCMLSAAGHRVDLLLRRRFIGAIREKGLSVDGVLGEYRAIADNLGLLAESKDATGMYDYILLTTKSYDTRSAVLDIEKLGERAKTVVSLQNGCGNVELLVAKFGDRRALGGRVITGFEIQEPGRVHISVTADAIHVGNGVAGPPVEEAVKLAEIIETAGHPCLAVEDIHMSLHAKLLYNCALNPLGAILGVHYGALADNAETRGIMDAIIEETFVVIEGTGGKTPWRNSAEYREFFYANLIPATYDHRASMLQDLESNKPTEVEALVGYVSLQGQKCGLATPTCDMLAAMVRFHEAQRVRGTSASSPS